MQLFYGDELEPHFQQSLFVSNTDMAHYFYCLDLDTPNTALQDALITLCDEALCYLEVKETMSQQSFLNANTNYQTCSLNN